MLQLASPFYISLCLFVCLFINTRKKKWRGRGGEKKKAFHVVVQCRREKQQTTKREGLGMGTSEGRALKLSKRVLRVTVSALPSAGPSRPQEQPSKAGQMCEDGRQRASPGGSTPASYPAVNSASLRGGEGYGPARPGPPRPSPRLASPPPLLRPPAAMGVFSFRAPSKPPLLLKYEAASSPAEAAGRRREVAGRCGAAVHLREETSLCSGGAVRVRLRAGV